MNKTITAPKHLRFGAVVMAFCALTFAAHAQYSNAVLGLNPILYYHLNDTTPVPGSLWTNAGTAGKVGTLFGLNSPSFQVTPGALPAEPGNGAAGFDGLSQYAYIAYSAAIDPSKGNPQAPFTIEGWYNPGTSSPSGGTGCVIYFANMGGETGWNLYQDSSVGWDWQLYDNSGTHLAARVSSGSPAAAGVFSHVVLVWDGTNASEYVNGALAAGPTPAPTFVPIGYDSGGDAAMVVSIGSQNIWCLCSPPPASSYWGGNAQEVAVYTNALSAATILAHYQNGTNAAPAQTYESLVTALNPLLYYRLNDPAYVDPTPGAKPLPFQPGQPLAQNLGSLGPSYDGTYEPGAVAGIPGAPYAGFGSNNYAVEINGQPDIINFTSVEIPPLVTLTNVANFTFTCWFYNNSYQLASGQSIMSCRLAADENSAATEVWFWDQTNLSTCWNAGDYAISYGNQECPPVAAWSFVAAVWTPSNTTLFVNGVATSVVSGHTPIDFSTMGPIVLGDDLEIPWGGSANCLMQEVAFFTNALPLAQLQSLYNAAGQPPQAVSVTQTPPGPTNYEGQTITFDVTTHGSGPIAYQWLENGQQLTGQTGTSLVLNNAVLTNSGNYSVAVSSPYGAVTSSVVVLDVVSSPPLIQQPTPAAVTRYVNGYVAFTISAAGSAPLTYQWQLNGAPLNGATSTNLTMTALTAANAGSYSVVVANPAGTNTSASAVLTVLALPDNYAGAMMALGPQAYWPLNETSGTTAHDYSGGHDGAITGGVTLDQPGATFPGTASNPAMVFDGSSGYINTPLLLNGWQGTFLALADATATGVVYVPGIMSARGGPGGDCGILLYADGETIMYTWANQQDTWGWYEVDSESGLKLTPNTWSFLALSVGSNQTVIYVDSGNGLLSETNDVSTVGVTNTGPLLIGYDPKNQSTPPQDYFQGGISHAAFFNRALSPAEIAALDQVLGGAALGAPRILNQPVPQSAFEGSAATFTVSAVGALPLSFQWQFNSDNIPGATGQTLVIPSVDYANAGNYTVVVSNAMNTAASQPAQLTVLDPPIPGNLAYGLVAHYKFDGDCTDSSGNENNGFPENSPQFVAGKIGSGAIQVYDSKAVPYLFQYVSLADPTALQFNAGDSFSVSLWLNYTGTPGDLPIIGNAYNSTGAFGWVLADSYWQDGKGGNITFSIVGVTTYAYFVAVNPAGPMNDGNWHHLVLVNDEINSVVEAFTDGVLVQAVNVNVDSLNTGYPTAIGNDPSGIYTGANAAGGYTIDDVGIWRRALTPSDVQSIYAAGATGNGFDTFGPVQLASKWTSTGQLQISWQQGTLQSATNLTGPWTAVTGATAPVYVVAPTNSQQFYRVQ
jgi:hypothetical protein